MAEFEINGRELRVSIPLFLIFGAIIGVVWFLYDKQQIDIDANAQTLNDREAAINKAELMYDDFQIFKQRYLDDRNIDSARFDSIMKEIATIKAKLP